MKFKPSVALLGICGLTAMVPARAHALDGIFLATRDAVQEDRSEVRQARKTKRTEQQARQVKSEDEYKHESERGYGYGYERRHHEQDDGRGRR